MDDTIFITLEVDMIAPQEQEHVAQLFIQLICQFFAQNLARSSLSELIHILSRRPRQSLLEIASPHLWPPN